MVLLRTLLHPIGTSVVSMYQDQGKLAAIRWRLDAECCISPRSMRICGHNLSDAQRPPPQELRGIQKSALLIEIKPVQPLVFCRERGVI